MRSKRLRNLVFGIAAVAYGLVFGEVFLRLVEPQAILPRYVTATEAGIRGNIPGATYYHYTPEVTVEMRINRQGMRADREFTPAPPRGVCRVAMVGDSFFMGYEADLPDSIAGQIELQLAEAGYRAEVLNFAVSGFGTAEMLRKYEAEIAGFDPDVLVYQFHQTDFDDNIRAGLYRLTPDGGVEDTGARYVPAVGIRQTLARLPAYRWISDNSHLHAFLRQKASQQAKRLVAALRFGGPAGPANAGDLPVAPATPAAPAADVPAAPTRAERLTSALVTESFRRAEAAGTEWFLFDIPQRRNRTTFESDLGRLVLPEEVRARTVSPLAAFRDAAAPEVKIYWEEGHGHLTPLGNRLATAVLVEAMLSRAAARMQLCRVGVL